jgi:hypothetical protein
MTVAQLIGFLNEQPDDAEVRLAFQPAWPFEYTISSEIPVIGPDEIRQTIRDMSVGDPELEELEKVDNIVYICEGTQERYLPGSVARTAGW